MKPEDSLHRRAEPKRQCPADPFSTPAMTPDGVAANGRMDHARELQGEPESLGLFERVLSRENMALAWQQVRANKGAAGVDGMSVLAFPGFAREHWERIREELQTGRYRPQAVKRVLIPKANGGKRPLGIATVVDRIIQQAIAQVLGPIYDPEFSESSYGFRPMRSAHEAVRAVERGYKDGYRQAVDCDLKSFLDLSS